MKGLSSKHFALKVDVLYDWNIYCLQACQCIFQPGRFTGWGSDGVKAPHVSNVLMRLSFNCRGLHRHLDVALASLKEKTDSKELKDDDFLFLRYLMSREELTMNDIATLTLSLFFDGLPSVSFDRVRREEGEVGGGGGPLCQGCHRLSVFEGLSAVSYEPPI